jgi:YD repeat-containing protein
MDPTGATFYRTVSGYDHAGRLDRVVAPTGTITRTVYDGLGHVVSTWVGTDDTPTTGYWSPQNTAGTNLVKVSADEYDNGGAGRRQPYADDRVPRRRGGRPGDAVRLRLARPAGGRQGGRPGEGSVQDLTQIPPWLPRG